MVESLIRSGSHRALRQPQSRALELLAGPTVLGLTLLGQK